MFKSDWSETDKKNVIWNWAAITGTISVTFLEERAEYISKGFCTRSFRGEVSNIFFSERQIIGKKHLLFNKLAVPLLLGMSAQAETR